MTAEELNSVRDKKRAIRETENRLQIMRLTVGSLQPAFDGLPGGKSVEDMTYSELAAYLEQNVNIMKTPLPGQCRNVIKLMTGEETGTQKEVSTSETVCSFSCAQA